jgi:hypothetical protein
MDARIASRAISTIEIVSQVAITIVVGLHLNGLSGKYLRIAWHCTLNRSSSLSTNTISPAARALFEYCFVDRWDLSGDLALLSC